MERLNDIMGRATHRRQYSSEQRPMPQEQQGNQGQVRQTQPQFQQSQQESQASAMRRPSRPLPEQTGRMGQRRQYAPQQVPSTRRHQGEPSMQGVPDTLPDGLEERPYGTNSRSLYSRPTQSTRPRSTPDGSTAYQQVRSENQRPQYVPSEQPSYPLKTRPIQAYRHTEDYTVSPTARADVAQEWEDDDDRAAGMQYGDWEEDEGEVVVYQQANADYQQAPAYPQHPLVTRSLREVQLQAASPPVPQARTQEVQRHHRMTQPLDPKVVSETERERYTGQEFASSRQIQQRPVRQIVPQNTLREVALQPSAAVVPIPSPSSKLVCPKCRGAGYLRADVPYGHPNFGKPIACECKEAERKEKRRQQLRDMSNMDAFRNSTFRTFNPRVPGVQEACRAAFEFAQNPAGWLFLIGPNGCGKTHLAAAIANQSLDDGAVVLFAVVPDLLDHLRAAFAPTATEVYDQLFAKMREAELLILDDLGAQQSSPWANEKLFQLLNYRYNMGMPTVITANLKGLQGVDERIRSRLSDINLVATVVLDRAKDYRPNQPRRD